MLVFLFVVGFLPSVRRDVEREREGEHEWAGQWSRTRTHTHTHKYKYSFDTNTHTHTKIVFVSNVNELLRQFNELCEAETPKHTHTHSHTPGRKTWKSFLNLHSQPKIIYSRIFMVLLVPFAVFHIVEGGNDTRNMSKWIWRSMGSSSYQIKGSF